MLCQSVYLLLYNDNYSMTSGSWCIHYRDEVYHDANENNAAGNYRINNKRTASKSRAHQLILD